MPATSPAEADVPPRPNLLRRIVDSPVTNLAVSCVLVATSLAEGWDTLREDISQLHVKAHHGVLLFGLVGLVRSLEEIADTNEKARQFRERARKASGA